MTRRRTEGRRAAKRKAREDRLRVAKAIRWAKPRTLVDVMGVDAVRAAKATLEAVQNGKGVEETIAPAEALPDDVAAPEGVTEGVTEGAPAKARPPSSEENALAARLARLTDNPRLVSEIAAAFPDPPPTDLTLDLGDTDAT